MPPDVTIRNTRICSPCADTFLLEITNLIINVLCLLNKPLFTESATIVQAGMIYAYFLQQNIS